MTAAAADGINLTAAYEWYDFFTRNNLDVFDVLHGAISVAILYWPDDFLRRREGIGQFLYAKKPSNRFVRPNGSSDEADSVDHQPQKVRGWAADESNHTSEPHASIPNEETPTTEKDISRSRKRDLEVAATKTQSRTKTNKPLSNAHKDCKTSALQKKSNSIELRTSPVTAPYQEEATNSSDDSEATITNTTLQQKRGTARKSGVAIKKEKQNNEVESQDVQVSQAKRFCGDTILSSAISNNGTPRFRDDHKKERPHDQEATKVMSSPATAPNDASGPMKVNSSKAEIKEIVHDEAALERKLESAKRKLQDGYKIAHNAKKKTRMVEARDIHQKNATVPENW